MYRGKPNLMLTPYMLKIPIIIASLLIVLQGISSGETTSFSILGNPGYPRPREVFENLATDKGTATVNHFHVVGHRLKDGSDCAWVYWEEGRAIILWEPTRYPEYPVNLSISRRFLSLDRDLVATDKEIKGSTCLVTRKWAEDMIKACKKHGDHFVITKK